MRTLEGEWIETERAAVGPLVRSVPRSPHRLVRWFEALRPGGGDRLDPLHDWLAERATLDDLRWVVRQELAADPGLDDLLALTRVGMPSQPKEAMGHGRQDGSHTGRLQRHGRALGVESDGARAPWEALAISNLMVGLAANRRYAWQAVGALAAVELTRPDLAGRIERALERLGVAGRTPGSVQPPASVDRERSSAWSSMVLGPLVEEDPDRAPLLAEGAVLRLRAGARALRRYRSELGLPP